MWIRLCSNGWWSELVTKGWRCKGPWSSSNSCLFPLLSTVSSFLGAPASLSVDCYWIDTANPSSVLDFSLFFYLSHWCKQKERKLAFLRQEIWVLFLLVYRTTSAFFRHCTRENNSCLMKLIMPDVTVPDFSSPLSFVSLFAPLYCGCTTLGHLSLREQFSPFPRQLGNTVSRSMSPLILLKAISASSSSYTKVILGYWALYLGGGMTLFHSDYVEQLLVCKNKLYAIFSPPSSMPALIWRG